MKAWSILVGGELRGARDGETIEVTNPATGEAIGTVPRCREADVDDAVAAARAAFAGWRATNPLERAARLGALADAITEHAEELAMLDVLENGSPIREMRGDAFAAAAQLRYFAGLALALRGETIPGEADRLNYTLMEPFGVVGRIVPFNHPLMFAAGRAAAPLIAGNTLVVKPSEHTSTSALALAELASELLPPGVFNVVTGYGEEAGDALVTHRDVRRIAFTGSAEVGRAIQRRAATHVVKTVTLELGGKNPIVVFADADIEAAIAGALRGMNFTWQGQSCGSTSRLLVHSSLHGEFVSRLGERMDAMRSGPPQEEQTETGAIVHRRQYEKVLSYLAIGREEGARVVAGGGPPDDPRLANGLFVRPTLFDGVAPGSRLAQEEIFGPVLAAMGFETYEQALAIANGVSLGLTASVYTSDLGVAHRFARDVQAGYVWVNDTAKHIPGTAFGGVKDSGVGREEGAEELASYAQVKNVNVSFG
ncbi:MAG TPA: aldehyde dehydrogenase family protein [Solirubrobacteraceae bacterium]|nr:aldehyde dehydrogenase family protein [Solirubrobacteraceae bacterium]